MSILRPSIRIDQPFYRSGPQPCPYLPGRVERKLFTKLEGLAAGDMNTSLSQAGFRRSHDILYRPVCPGCDACIPVRIPVARFAPGRSMRRLTRRNGDLHRQVTAALASPGLYDLFARYQAFRHADSEMSGMGPEEFRDMVDEGKVDTHLLQLCWSDGRPAGAMLADRLEDGYSAVYSFFDPTDPSRSLGTYLIMQLVEACREMGLAYVYLGYWIRGSRKMAYKARFQPLEALGRDGWMPARLPHPDQGGTRGPFGAV